MSQKFAALPSGTKIAIYASCGGAGAILLSAFIFCCIRQRRAGRRERDAYNAKIEKEREEAYKDQMELREKGLGGWDQGSKQGEDALGGWGGTHVVGGAGEKDVPPVPTVPAGVAYGGRISRSASPAVSTGVPREGNMSPAPQSPRQWGGGNQGGMIHNAGNAYTGAFGGNTNYNAAPANYSNPSSNSGNSYYGNSNGYSNPSNDYNNFTPQNFERSPSFGQVPQQGRRFSGHGGYQRF